MMTTLAKPSITESSPKPTRATDPATIPAAIATAPSIDIHTRLSHDSAFARRASRSVVARSGTRRTGAGAIGSAAHASTLRGGWTASSNSVPSRVSMYMTILPSRRRLTSPAAFRAPYVVRHQLLRPLDDPCEVAHAELAAAGRVR